MEFMSQVFHEAIFFFFYRAFLSSSFLTIYLTCLPSISTTTFKFHMFTVDGRFGGRQWGRIIGFWLKTNCRRGAFSVS